MSDLAAGAAPRAATVPDDLPARLAGKYMLFRLGAEQYAVDVPHVREIVGLLEVTRVPRARPFLRGVVNLRGKVIPVVDLRVQLGMERRDAASTDVIIVVERLLEGRALQLGLLVDEVLEVALLGADTIAPPPPLGHGLVGDDLLRGVARRGDRIAFLLDVERVLGAEEAREARAAAAS